MDKDFIIKQLLSEDGYSIKGLGEIPSIIDAVCALIQTTYQATVNTYEFKQEIMTFIEVSDVAVLHLVHTEDSIYLVWAFHRLNSNVATGQGLPAYYQCIYGSTPSFFSFATYVKHNEGFKIITSMSGISQ